MALHSSCNISQVGFVSKLIKPIRFDLFFHKLSVVTSLLDSVVSIAHEEKVFGVQKMGAFC